MGRTSLNRRGRGQGVTDRPNGATHDRVNGASEARAVDEFVEHAGRDEG